LKAEIEEKKGKRISSAEAWRKHQHANFKHQFEEFEYEANIHFIVSIDDISSMMETLISLLFLDTKNGIETQFAIKLAG
jgi:hypothetical protein